MIIDGHAHAAGDFLNGNNIIRILDENQVDYVVLVGLRKSILKKTKTYLLFQSFLKNIL